MFFFIVFASWCVVLWRARPTFTIELSRRSQIGEHASLLHDKFEIIAKNYKNYGRGCQNERNPYRNESKLNRNYLFKYMMFPKHICQTHSHYRCKLLHNILPWNVSLTRAALGSWHSNFVQLNILRLLMFYYLNLLDNWRRCGRLNIGLIFRENRHSKTVILSNFFPTHFAKIFTVHVSNWCARRYCKFYVDI